MKAIRLLLVSFFVLSLSATNVVASEKCHKSDESHKSHKSHKSDKHHTDKKSDCDKSSVIDQAYPQAQAEVLETFMAIRQSIMDGAGLGADTEFMDQLISFHAYGPKFTEFNDGKLYDSAGNEENERTLFGTIVDPGGVKQFAVLGDTLKIAVYYGNVANLTFVSDFILEIGETEYTINNLITLLFVKTKGEWKMVHEHHSPAVIE